MEVVTDDGEATFIRWEEWWPFPRQLIRPAIDLFERQRTRFVDEAMEIERQLNAI
jgi:hypothetical protein